MTKVINVSLMSKYTFVNGMLAALGMSWVLDNGFWNILIDTLLGWIYVSYKITQFYFG